MGGGGGGGVIDMIVCGGGGSASRLLFFPRVKRIPSHSHETCDCEELTLPLSTRLLPMPFPTISPQGGRVTVAVSYVTSPESSAIQWLPPAQTAGKNYPYLFTQCQAIHARSMVPCIDAPGHKVCEGGGGKTCRALFSTRAPPSLTPPFVTAGAPPPTPTHNRRPDLFS